MEDNAPSSTAASNGKRKLYVACNACRFRKVKCDREPRLEQGYSACTNCESSSMECVLTVNPPKKRMGKRMKMLQEQKEANGAVSLPPSSNPAPTETLSSTILDTDGLSMPPPSTSSFQHDVAMSPGFSGLLRAVEQEEAAAASNGTTSTYPMRATLGASSGDTNAASQGQDTQQPQIPIIQNGMFAAFSSQSTNGFRVSDGRVQGGNTLALEPRRSSSEMDGATIHSIASESPTNAAFTPKSATAVSDQSSPEAVISHASFLESAVATSTRPNAPKRRNPFDKPESAFSGQVGFVGGLLGIASLDKHMLDVCTKSYFDSLGQCIGFIRPEWFWPRYHAFFSRYAGLFQHPSPESNEEPLSELLIIAVACRGAGASQFANRFELQSDLFQHYCRLIKDRERLVRDGFDALESVILMVEHADGSPRPLAEPMSVKGVYDVDVLSHEGLIRLMKKLELNLEKPFGAKLQGRDAIRQRILCWTIYVYDAIRSEAGRTLPLLHEDEISLTRTLPGHHQQPMRLMFRDYFIDLANICRRVACKIQSPRAQEHGIDPHDVIRILDDLKAWHDNLIPLFAWDWNDMLHITGPSDAEDQTRRTFLIFLFLGQWLTLEYAIEEIGVSASCDAAAKQEMLRRLEAEVDVTLDRQVLVCDHGTLFGLIRLHPGMMQSWTITWAMWSLKKMETITAQEANGRLASAKADQTFHRYQSAVLCFISATASCDSSPRTPTVVQDLMNGLTKVNDARKASRLTFDSV